VPLWLIRSGNVADFSKLTCEDLCQPCSTFRKATTHLESCAQLSAIQASSGLDGQILNLVVQTAIQEYDDVGIYLATEVSTTGLIFHAL
jgi:hypothetical protein